MIPDHPDHIAAFWEYLLYIGYWFSWDYDDDKRAKPVADVWRQVYENGHYEFYYGDPCGCDDSGGDGDCPVCDDYFPQEISYTFEPYDPRTEYDTVPAGFPSSPFVWGSDVNISGAAENDIFVRIPFPEQTNFREIIEGVVNVLKSLLEIDQINNFPRLKFRFTGKGRLQVYLLKILQGGKCLITIDGKLNSARMFDLQSASLFNPTTLDVLLAELGVSLIAGTLVQEEIVEFNIDEEGDHYLDITFLPNVVPPNVGFGGGVRKINLCDMDAKAAPPIRTNPDGTVDEWNGDSWQPLPGRPPRGIIQLSGLETCECEEDMCNCAFVVKIDPCTGQQWYKDDKGVIHYLDNITPGSQPNLPPENPDIPVTQTLACYKANAAWDIIERLADAVFDVYTEDSSALAAITLQRRYPDMKLDNWQLYRFGFNWTSTPDYEEISGMWDEHREDLKAVFICSMQDVLFKSQQLTAGDLALILDYDFDSPEADLDDLLTKMLAVPEEIYWKEQAAFYVQSQTGVCNCTGSEPTPPEQTEPEAGQFGLYAGEVVGNINTSMTPAGSRAASTPRGNKISEVKYTGEAYDAGLNQHAEIFVMWEATEMLTNVSLELLWKYTGSPSDSENLAYFDFRFYYSEGETDNWALLPGFVGEFAKNDADNPEAFFGAVNSQGIPWDDAIMTTDMRYIGVWARFMIPSDNTTGIIPGGDLTIQAFKAKADSGGNYRATLIPMIFVPKAL